MPVNHADRIDYADQLVPLLRAIARRLDGMTIMRASEITGIPNWKIGRILSRGITSPSYVDMTKLIVFAGLSPNEGASIVGLYGSDMFADYDTQQTVKQVTALMTRLHTSGLDEATQERLLKHFEVLVTAEQLMQGERVPKDEAVSN